MTDLLEEAARLLTDANELRAIDKPATASILEQESARLLSEHNAVTPTEAADADVAAPEEGWLSPDRPDTPIFDDEDGEPE